MNKKKYSNINEVRDSIDRIDDQIINLISKRKILVVEAVRLKNRDQIIDQERIERIIKKLNVEAQKKNLPDGLVEKLWRTMIKEFIDYEERIFDKVHQED